MVEFDPFKTLFIIIVALIFWVLLIGLSAKGLYQSYIRKDWNNVLVFGFCLGIFFLAGFYGFPYLIENFGMSFKDALNFDVR